MTIHLPFQLRHFAGLLRERCFVTLSQFLYTLGEGLADAVHLAVYGGGVLLLTVERDLSAGCAAHFQQQRSRPPRPVINGGMARRVRLANADDLRHDAADLGERVELPLALTAFRGKKA